MIKNAKDLKCAIREFSFECLNENLSFQQPKKIENIILIMGSSRSGSSALYSYIKNNSNILCPHGEDQTYWNLMDYNHVENLHDSDALENKIIDFKKLNFLIKSDLSNNIQNIASLYKIYLMRMYWQHPLLFYSHDKNLQIIKSLTSSNNSMSYREFRNHFKVSSDRYDGISKISENNLELNFSADRPIIEEPPFIEIFPRKTKDSSTTLLLKSPANNYRIDYLKSIFPNAKFSFILIARAPEQTINGLYEGWNSNSFHSHNLSGVCDLKIKNYPDNSWWKFDLPPNWSNYTSANLFEVCAFQWRSSYLAILKEIKNHEYIKINYEDLFDLKSLNSKLLSWLEAKDIHFNDNPTIETVMTTSLPNLNKWKNHQEPILEAIEVLECKKVQKEMENL